MSAEIFACSARQLPRTASPADLTMSPAALISRSTFWIAAAAAACACSMRIGAAPDAAAGKVLFTRSRVMSVLGHELAARLEQIIGAAEHGRLVHREIDHAVRHDHVE